MLASTSPRRAALLETLGRPFSVLDPGVADEAEAALAADARRRGAPIEGALRRLAAAKLLASLPRCAPEAEVLAADTAVVDGERMLGKARDLAEARDVLWSLRGRVHAVVSAVALRDRRARLRIGIATTEVRFRAFSREALEAYLARGVWGGKAGAYGEQDPEAAALIEAVTGSASNVRGLPLELVGALLAPGEDA